MKQILDNTELIKEKILKFQSRDDVYMVSIMQRKKDHPEAPANENARMLANYYIRNMEYFDRKMPLIKEYCDKFGARAYIRAEVKSCKGINRQILKFMVDQLDNTDIGYSTLTREIIAGYHASRAKRMMLDLDDVEIGFVQELKECLETNFKMDKRDNELDDIFILPTFNGWHLISPGFRPDIILGKYKLPKDTLKTDPDTILYASKEVFNEVPN